MQVGMWLMGALWLIGAMVSILLLKRPQVGSRLAYLLAGAGSAAGFLLALKLVTTQNRIVLNVWPVAPQLRFSFIWDQWSAFFLLVVTLVAFFVSIGALGIVKPKEPGQISKTEGWVGAGFNLFLISMVLVLGAANSFSFLVTWELMSVISFLLIMTDHERPQVRRAGLIYLVMTHIGTGFLMAGFLLLYRITGSLEFDAYHQLGEMLPTGMGLVLFLLFLIGFGTKAGLIPLHVWLPQAHSVAPSHVSALLSAVMIKTALYGMLRFIFQFLGEFPFWWGGLLLGLGLASALIGILYGVIQKEMKRLLAYSSIENMGLIFTGLGLAMMLMAKGYHSLAALPLMALLFHTINHALFKSLLFMGTGALLRETDEGRMDRLGGLIHVMPQMALLFLIGCLAISAMPFLNGFVSKWLLFRSLLETTQVGDSLLLVLGITGAVLLVLVGTLVAFAFVKLFGIVFLSRPRLNFKQTIEEAPVVLRLSMAGQVIMILLIGLFPGSVASGLSPLTKQVIDDNQWPNISWSVLSYVKPTFQGVDSHAVVNEGVLSPLLVLALFLAVIMLTLIILRVVGGPSRREIVETWACGIPLTPAMSYTGRSFSHSLLVFFKGFFATRHHVQKEGGALHFGLGVQNFFLRYLYQPLLHGVVTFATWIRRIQDGRIHAYLTYLFLTLIVLLLLGTR